MSETSLECRPIKIIGPVIGINLANILPLQIEWHGGTNKGGNMLPTVLIHYSITYIIGDARVKLCE